MNAEAPKPEAGAASAPLLEKSMIAILREAHVGTAEEIPALARRHVPSFGGVDAICYLADLQQAVLVPFLGPEYDDVDGRPGSLAIDSTLAGRAFQYAQILTQQRHEDELTVWIPLLDGTERLGVIAIHIAAGDADEALRVHGDRLRAFASLFAELIMTKTMYGDTVVRLRRREPMSLAAELQWSLLPPLTFACRDVTVAGALEPAYEVAGDTIDYAVDAGIAKVALFDGMGHGLTSSQLAAMSVSTYRHSRRLGRTLVDTCADVDTTLYSTFGGRMFTTAVFAELDTTLGVLTWVNAGHPEPLLLRHGQLIKSLHVAPRPPLGVNLSGGSVPEVGEEHLEPGDCVLFYTDGVTEARSPDGEFFGEQRFVDVVIRNLASGLPAPETMRRVVRAILAHQQGHLTDDASIVMVQWRTDVAALLPTAEPSAT